MVLANPIRLISDIKVFSRKKVKPVRSFEHSLESLETASPFTLGHRSMEGKIRQTLVEDGEMTSFVMREGKSGPSISVDGDDATSAALQQIKMDPNLDSLRSAKRNLSRQISRPGNRVNQSTRLHVNAVLDSVSKGPPFFNPALGIINTKSNIISRWDIYCLLLLAYTAIVTPFEVSFLTTSLNHLFYLNRLVDFSFFVDMILNFYLPYTDNIGRLQMDQAKIRSHYLKGWFWVDLISVLPFDSLKYILRTENVDKLQVLRVIRLLRIMKLLRILRTSRLFKRWESRLAINYASLNLVLLLIALCFLSHWMACIWATILAIDGDDHLKDFCSPNDGYCPRPLADETDEEYSLRIQAIWDERPFAIYSQLVFWALGMTLGIGYPIGYVTQLQRIVLLSFMILAGIANALIIGNVVSTIDSAQADLRDFHQAMDHLNAFIRNRNLNNENVKVMLNGDVVDGPTLVSRCREFYLFANTYLKRLRHFRSIQATGCKSLSTAMAATMYTSMVKRVEFFKLGGEDLISQLAENVQTEIYCVYDRVFHNDDLADSLYIICVGSVFVHFNILSEGESFGNRVFFATHSKAKRGHTATCLSNCVLYRLMRPVLMEALAKYGDCWVSKNGVQIPYLSIVRMYANLMQLSGVVRRAAVLALRYGFEAGVQVLMKEFGEQNVMEEKCPLVDIYASYTRRLVKAGANCSVAVTAHSEMRRSSEIARDRSFRSKAGASGRPGATEGPADLREGPKWELARLPSSSGGVRGAKKELGCECGLPGSIGGASPQAQGGVLPLGEAHGSVQADPAEQAQARAQALAAVERESMQDEGELTSKNEEMRAAKVKQWHKQWEEEARAFELNRVRTHQQSLLAFLRHPAFRGLGLEAYHETFQDQQLTVQQLRQLLPADIAHVTGMPLGLALKVHRIVQKTRQEMDEEAAVHVAHMAEEDIEIQCLADIREGLAAEEIAVLLAWRRKVKERRQELEACLGNVRFAGLELQRYADVFDRERLDARQLYALPPESLASVSGMPLGDALRLKEILADPSVVEWLAGVWVSVTPGDVLEEESMVAGVIKRCCLSPSIRGALVEWRFRSKDQMHRLYTELRENDSMIG